MGSKGGGGPDLSRRGDATHPIRGRWQVVAQPFSVQAVRLARAANQRAGNPRSFASVQSRASSGSCLANQENGGLQRRTENRTANQNVSSARRVGRANQSGAISGGVLYFGGSFGSAGTCAQS